MEELLAAYPQYFKEIMEQRNAFKVQVIYTQIDRKKDNSPTFTSHYFNVDDQAYFYPASTVKMPIAILSLEKLNQLKVAGVDRNSAMITDTSFSGQTSVYNDPTSPDGKPSVAHYAKKIFLVSDNDAYNRLYEFLGQEGINRSLQSKGLKHSAIHHRLELALTEEENRQTNPIRFFGDTGQLVYEQPAQRSNEKFRHRHDSIGLAHYRKGQLINRPLDCSAKNKFPLDELTAVLKAVMFPDAVTAGHRFNLTESDIQFLWQYMSQLPSETKYPSYDSTLYWDAYVKFLLWGAEKGKLPDHIRIFNKVGDGYGFLTDVAYVVDFRNNIEFMLSATIYCNSDGVVNDDHYDYETVGFPFMKHLGEVIYQHELKRPRAVVPDLSRYQMNYDK
nr:serine hydrolase [Flavihumibacter rivuli]